MALDTTLSGADAESMASVADLTTYAAKMAVTISADVAAQEAALRSSAMFLDTSWNWAEPPATEEQALSFPSSASPDAIPTRIINAQCELALEVLAGADLFALASSRRIKSELVKIDGAVTEDVEYEGGGEGGGAARAFPKVDAMVRKFAKGLSSPSGGASAAMIGMTK